MNINIKELLLNVKNELDNCDQNTLCNICKLPTYKYNRITLNCTHIYHINCIKAKKLKIIKCPYCQKRNKISSDICQHLNCNNSTINDSKYCNVHINKIINKISKYENICGICNDYNSDIEKLKNLQNNNTTGVSNYLMKNGNLCSNKLKNNLHLCGIHNKKVINDIKKLENKINDYKNINTDINKSKELIY